MSTTSTSVSSIAHANPKVWLITGCSTGLGRAITLAALTHGDRVIATARNPAAIADLAEKGALALALDITASDEAISAAIQPGLEHYGRIDVLVNNAGYCSNGALEEASAQEVYDQYNTNVFGSLAVIRAVLPTMRAQKSGVVAIVGSMTGWRAWGGVGLYCSTKFALAGVTEALRQEIAPLGIDATCLELGNFRTEVLARSQDTYGFKNNIADYAPVTGAMRGQLATLSGAQPGDTDKGAQLIVELLTKTGRAKGKILPMRIPIGADAVAMARGAIVDAAKDLDEWESILTTGLEVEDTP